MGSYSRKLRETITRNFNRQVEVESVMDTTNDNFQRLDILTYVPDENHGRIRIMGGQMSYGITDDPVDENCVFLIGRGPVDGITLPGFPNDEIFFYGRCNYRVLTAVGVIDTVEEDDIEEEQSWVFDTPIDSPSSTRDSMHTVIGIYADSSGVASSVFMGGTVDFEEIIYQRANRGSDLRGYPGESYEEAYGEFDESGHSGGDAL